MGHLLSPLAERGSLLGQGLSGGVLSVKAKVRDLLSEMKKKMLPSGRWRTVTASGFALRADEPGYVDYSEFDDETSRFGLRAVDPWRPLTQGRR
jgi:hypothetical protein